MLEGGKRVVHKTYRNVKVSVITIVLNNSDFLRETIKSVINQDYNDYEFIVIDGGSDDNTLDVLKEFEPYIDYWISEKDRGIYDACNKGVNYANGEWLNFMNAGDRFVNNTVITDTFKQDIKGEISFIYSDWFVCDLKKSPKNLIKGIASYNNSKILHQSVFYKKELHKLYGLYLITPKLIISDYFFFYLLPNYYFFKSEIPISINDISGVSNKPYWTSKQKLAVNYLLGRISFNMLFLQSIKLYLHIIRLFLKKSIINRK
jgi:glycosyltransferase involved in cell wall biosynthesis